MLELFVVGTIWFWALIIIELIILFCFVEYENGIGATVSMVIFACCLQWLGDVNIIGFITGNPLQLMAVVASYFMLGAIWGVIKWWLYCRSILDEYNELRAEFFESKSMPANTKVMPQEMKVKWKEKLANHWSSTSGAKNLGETPRARKNKNRIIRWMSFWPISMVWSIGNDFVKQIFRAIYNKIGGFLQHIADNMFGKIQDDFE